MHTFALFNYPRRIFNEIGFAIFFIIDEEDHQKSFQKKGTSFVYHLLFWLIGVTAISCALDLVARGTSSGGELVL